jgi:hypothetical protein
MLSKDTMSGKVTCLQQSGECTVVQGACENNSAEKKIVVNDAFELTLVQIVSNMEGLETVNENKIRVFSSIHVAVAAGRLSTWAC